MSSKYILDECHTAESSARHLVFTCVAIKESKMKHEDNA